jgi:hypothetical protein
MDIVALEGVPRAGAGDLIGRSLKYWLMFSK